MVASMGQPSRERLGALISKLDLGSRLRLLMTLISPAQGAVFAPLALKFVKWTLHLLIPD